MGMLRRSAVAGTAVCLLLGLGGTGCSKTGSGFDLTRLIQPRWPSPSPGPVPNSPANALRLLEWCYNNKSLSACRELFTEDFRWFCSPLDSAGAEWRTTPWTRDDELISATHLFFGGGADQPPATTIQLALDRSFSVYPDPNYGGWDAAGRWHKSIRTNVQLSVGTTDGNMIAISGHAIFYFVQGDSALIPEELRRRGFGPDSSRWYIRRWDDETAQSPGLAPARSQALGVAAVARRPADFDAQPTKSVTWCRLKALYR